MPFAAVVIEFGLQHFVHFIVLRRNMPPLIALRPPPTAGGGRWSEFRIEVVFGIHIGSLAARLRCPLFARTTFISLTATPSTAATTTRATIFAPFAVAGRSAANGFFLTGFLVVEGPWSGRIVIVDKCFAPRIDIAGVDITRTYAARILFTWFYVAWIQITRIDVARIDVRFAAFIVRLFFRTTPTPATSTPTTARITFVIRGPIKPEPFLGCGKFGLAGDKVFGFKRFSSRFRMCLGRPIFDETIAESALRGDFFSPRRTAFFIPPAVSVSILISVSARTAVTPIPPLIATTTTISLAAISIATVAFTSFTFTWRSNRPRFRFGPSRRGKQIRRQIVIDRRHGCCCYGVGSDRSGGRRSRFWLGFRLWLSDRQAQHSGQFTPVAGGLGGFLGCGLRGFGDRRRSRSHRLGNCRLLRNGSRRGLDRGGLARGRGLGFLRGGGGQADRFEQRGPVVFSWCLCHAVIQC